MLNIQKNINIAPYTTFKIGGPAKYFAEVNSEEDIFEALRYAKDNGLQFFILGGGSNILVNDKGFDGLIIKMKLDDLKMDVSRGIIEIGAGVILAKIVKNSTAEGLTGLEWASGIPGTVGGALRGNARAFGRNIGMSVETIEALDITTLERTTYNNSECEFAYWGSMFKKNPNLIILSAKIKLEKGDAEKSQQEARNIIVKRMAIHPTGSSAGSFFLNPVVFDEKLRERFEKDSGTACRDNKIPAGWLIDEVGLRGKKIGGIQVSEKHANFVINIGGGTAEEVVMLTSFVKQQVRDKLGIELQEEIQFVGF